MHRNSLSCLRRPLLMGLAPLGSGVSIVLMTFLSMANAKEVEPSCVADKSQQLGKTQIRMNHYDVFRNDNNIGNHQVCFIQSENQLKVLIETKMKVEFLSLTVYRYHYVSQEVWDSNSLNRVETRVDNNGAISKTLALRNQNGFWVNRSDSSGLIQDSFLTTNHWNINAMSQNKLFNTITGNLNNVMISRAPVGSEQQSGLREFQVRGMLNIDTYYDVDGNWQGMRFDHKDGSEIEFRCVVCTNTPEVPT